MDNHSRKARALSEEELIEWEKVFTDIEESIELVYKNGVEL